MNYNAKINASDGCEYPRLKSVDEGDKPHEFDPTPQPSSVYDPTYSIGEQIAADLSLDIN